MIVIIADEAFSIIACFDWLWEYNTVNKKIVTGNENAQLQKFQIMKILSLLPFTISYFRDDWKTELFFKLELVIRIH